jgi:hypothetical protein
MTILATADTLSTIPADFQKRIGLSFLSLIQQFIAKFYLLCHFLYLFGCLIYSTVPHNSRLITNFAAKYKYYEPKAKKSPIT